MNTYWSKLTKELQKWASLRKAEIRSLCADAINCAPIEAALDRMVKNLVWIMKGLFNSTLFGMQFPTPASLLSSMFLLDVSESVTVLKPYLELTWRWKDLYLMSSSYGTTLSIIDLLDCHNPKCPSSRWSGPSPRSSSACAQTPSLPCAMPMRRRGPAPWHPSSGPS